MDRSDVEELYYITPIANVLSIMKHGILSHNLSLKLRHDSVAMPEIQEIRKDKKIPGINTKLHDYANLYFDAHNPTLSKLRKRNNEICILRIDDNILDLPGVVTTSRNAASDYVRFYPVIDGLGALDKDTVFATFWLHPEDTIAEWRHKSIKCAEVLVPKKADSKFVLGAFVANRVALKAFKQQNTGLNVCIRSGIFF
jgi:hypothetical protein